MEEKGKQRIMGLISTIRRWISMLFKSQAEKDFQITAPDYAEMDAVVCTCANLYAGRPPWVNGKDGDKTFNLA